MREVLYSITRRTKLNKLSQTSVTLAAGGTKRLDSPSANLVGKHLMIYVSFKTTNHVSSKFSFDGLNSGGVQFSVVRLFDFYTLLAL